MGALKRKVDLDDWTYCGIAVVGSCKLSCSGRKSVALGAGHLVALSVKVDVATVLLMPALIEIAFSDCVKFIRTGY